MRQDLLHRVSSHLFRKGLGQDKADHRLTHHRGGRNGADVGSLDRGRGDRSRPDIHGGKRGIEGRNGLHCRPNDQGKAIGDPALESSRAIGGTLGAPLSSRENGIVHLGAGKSCRLEAQPKLHPLDRLNGEKGLGQPSVETLVPLHVAAESHRKAQRPNLEDPAQGVAGLFRRPDFLDHAGAAFRVGTKDLGEQGLAPERLGIGPQRLGGARPGDRSDRADHRKDIHAKKT